MMIQTRVLGVTNSLKGAKVHAVYTDYVGETIRTVCIGLVIVDLVILDPSEANRLCQRCFKDRPLPWEGTT